MPDDRWRERSLVEMKAVYQTLPPRPPGCPERHWAAFIGVIRDGRTYRDVGHALGVTPERVRQMILHVDRCARLGIGFRWWLRQAERTTTIGTPPGGD